MFCEKGFLENFTRFTGKHLCQSLFFNKVAGPTLSTIILSDYDEVFKPDLGTLKNVEVESTVN